MLHGGRNIKERPENFHTGPKLVILSTSRPSATQYGRPLPSGLIAYIYEKDEQRN